jgi:hypothetical protein
MTSEWVFAQLSSSKADRPLLGGYTATITTGPHTGIGGHPPISRLTDLAGQYS